MIGIYMNVQNLRFCHKKEKRKKKKKKPISQGLYVCRYMYYSIMIFFF